MISAVVTQTREWSVLLRCARARAHGQPPDAALLQEVAADFDWSAFAALARAHGLTAIAADALHAASAVPEPDASSLRRATGHDARRAFRHAHELIRLADGFRTEGIDALFYKGPVLAQLAYGNIALRDYADLDILTDPASLADTAAFLGKRGYTPVAELTPLQRTAFTRIDGDYAFRGDNGILAEVHCRVSSQRFGVRLSAAEQLRDSIAVDVLGTPVRTLAHADHALVLCVHGCKHEWQRLEWLVALVALLRTQTIDLGELMSRADAVHARRNVLLSLGLAACLLELELPRNIEVAVESDAELHGLITRAANHLTAGTEPSTAARLLFNMRSRDGFIDRVKFAYSWLALPTPEDWKAVRIPDRFAALYGIVRPLRLATRVLRRAP